MFDRCLKILFIFGSFSAVARGEDYGYYDDVRYTTTTTTSRPTSTSMTTTSPPTRTRRSVGDDECYAGDPNCDWKNDPSADQAWALYPTKKRLFSYFSGFSSRGNNSIREISPICRVDNHSCVVIHFQMYSEPKSGIVGLRVYQKPVHIALTDLMAYNDKAKKDYILYEDWGDHSDDWYTKEFPLKHFDSNFQIIVEGIFGEDRVIIQIKGISVRTECTGNTAYPITKQTASTTISTTTAMSTTTTERPMRENGDKTTDKVMTTTWSTTLPATKQPTTTETLHEGNGDTLTDKVTKSDTRVDSPPASAQSNPWPTTTLPTTLPTTKQPTTTPTLQEGNGDTITDKVTKSDIWVNSQPASPQSNPWSTTTWPTTLPTTLPTTKQQTTTQTLQEGNGDTITDKVTKSDARVDSPPASPHSNPWSTTTWPTTLPKTKQQTTTETLQEGNGCGDSRNPPIILYLIAPGNSLIDFRVRPRCSASAASGALTD